MRDKASNKNYGKAANLILTYFYENQYNNTRKWSLYIYEIC
jgi:hypothetical protein